MKKYAWLLIGSVWVAAIWLYASMPEQMATHWNAAGEANGYSGKALGLFLVPIIMIVIQALFTAIPKIDPIKSSGKENKKQLEGFMLLLALFMAYLFGLIVLWNKGTAFSMTQALIPAFAGMFYGIGALLKGIKRNWFMGIRTPWTMSSDTVWDKTHAAGNKIFKICGIIMLLGFIFPQYVLLLILVPVLVSTIGIILYSYVVFKNEQK